MTAKTVERLSSGAKINRAADDAAGLAISEKMRAQIRGLSQAARNIEDGVSLAQTADGGLSQIHDMLHRSNELTIQALSDTNTDAERDAIQLELNQLVKEIDDLANSVRFNHITPLNRDPDGVGTAIYRTETGLTSEIIMNQVSATVSTPPVNANGSFNFSRPIKTENCLSFCTAAAIR